MGEPEAVSRMRAGDIEAFAAMVREFQVPIVRYLFRLTGDEELSRDLAQDTFIQAYSGLARTRPNLSLKAWLYRIATNNAMRYFRRRAIVNFEPLEESGAPAASTDTAQDTADREAVHQALLSVPEKLRVCVVLHFVDGFKHREIADMLGISEDAARMRVTRGSEEFRRQYVASAGRIR